MRRFLLLALTPLAIACSDVPSAPVQPQSRALLGLPLLGGSSTGQRLLFCPNLLPTVSLTGTIDALGGVLSVSSLTLTVPDSAVTEPTLFALSVPTSLYMEVGLSAVGFEHYTFQKPVSVTIDYSRCSVPYGATLHAVYIDPLTKTILEDMGGTVNAGARTLTFTTGHFSSYAVAY